MATFNPIVWTDEGLALVARAIADNGTITFKEAWGSSTNYTGLERTLTAATFEDVFVTGAIGASITGPTTITSDVVISNASLQSDQTLNTIGIICDDNGTDVLLAVASAISPDIIPAAAGAPISYTYTCILILSSTANIQVTVSPTGVVLRSDIIDNLTSTSATNPLSANMGKWLNENKADLVGGRVPYSQLPESAIEFKGSWNASTNTPTLTQGVGTNGDCYIVSVGGTWNNIEFHEGDRILFDGVTTHTWIKLTGEAYVSGTQGNFLSVGQGGVISDSGKKPADYVGVVSGATAGNFASLKADGTIQDSGKKASDFVPPAASPTADHIATLKSDGTIKDSGKTAADFTYTNGTGISKSGNTFSANFGSVAGSVCQGNDSRLSDARTPTAHNQAASTITAGTLSGRVQANASAAGTLGNAQVRDIIISTTDLTPGTSALATGTLYFVYE